MPYNEPVSLFPAGLYMRCFGLFSLYLDGIPIYLNRKAGELLALLSCEGGGPLDKRAVAGMIWPNSGRKQSLNNLQKICKYIKSMKEKIPLDCGKTQVFLDMKKIDCDLNEFRRLYRKRPDPDACEQVLELYRGLLFYHNSYDWVAQWEAYYELRYIEILGHMIKYHERCGNIQAAKLYKRYLEE